MKEIDLKKTVYELTETYSELIKILKELGFIGVVNLVVRKTLGRMTTITRGCKKQGKNLIEVMKVLEEKGFKVKEI